MFAKIGFFILRNSLRETEMVYIRFECLQLSPICYHQFSLHTACGRIKTFHDSASTLLNQFTMPNLHYEYSGCPYIVETPCVILYLTECFFVKTGDKRFREGSFLSKKTFHIKGISNILCSIYINNSKMGFC